MRADLETTPLHKSLIKPVLMFGVEREIVVPLLGLVCMLLFAFRINFVTPCLAAALLMVGLPALRRINKKDPWAFRVLKSHLRIAGFYPPLAPHDSPRQSVRTL